jgi:cell division GTPase FtsZ
MLKKLIPIAASITIGLAALGALMTEGPSLKDQILAIDKELTVMRRATRSDPEVKAARAELQVALDKLNATVDAVMVRTNPKGKELIEKRKKLLEQYKAQQKAEGAKENPKQ